MAATTESVKSNTAPETAAVIVKEVTAPVEPSVADVVVETPAEPPIGVVDTTDVGLNLCGDDTLMNAMLNAALETLSTEEITSPADITRAQTALYTVIARFLVRKSEEDCFAFLKALLTYIEPQVVTGHFSPKLKFRGFENLPALTPDQQKEFVMLLFILTDTAPAKTRTTTAKAINWSIVRNDLVHATADDMLARLMKFYRV